MRGLYIHVPFCIAKCPYCDFYSVPLPDDNLLDAYTDEVCRRLKSSASDADTLYFGGGTPSLLGGHRLGRIINTAQHAGLTDNAEITLEANPADKLYDTFAAFVQAGGNRLSMGMQAASADGLRALGRRHTPDELMRAVEDAHRAGLTNLSLDIMLATPSQTTADIDAAVHLCRESKATHVSAYLLKIEPDTPFYAQQSSLSLPDEDDTVALYLHTVRTLVESGYTQYEVSNFAKPGFESRHNTKYWNAEDYLGIGPAAHSFTDGHRFSMPRSLTYFLDGGVPTVETDDEAIPSGSPEEYAMLRLRLCDGLVRNAFAARFKEEPPTVWWHRASRLPPSLVRVTDDAITFTTEGLLLSNALIARILWDE